MDCKPAPALPPRRSWQQPTTSFAAINVLGVASGSGGGNGASQPPRPSSNSSGSALSDDFVDCARLQEQEKFAKAAAACRDATNRLLLSSSFQLTPPSYPAPPRPPSRNGGDEARCARVGGSGCGEPSGTLAHGSPLPRALPPRAGAVSAAATGWPLQPSLFDTAASTTNPQKNQQEQQQQQQQASPGRPVAQQWASQHQQSHRFRNSNVLQKSSREQRRFATTTATNAPRPPAVPQRNSEWHWLVAPTTLAPPVPIVVRPSSSHLMSQNEPAARPPSTTPASSGVAAVAATTNSMQQSPVLRHTRPLPPPRPEGPIAPAVALSAPSTPSPTPLRPASSFRMAGRAVPVRPESSSTPPPSRSSNSEQQQVTVSLQAPRPDGERVTNEYVETPFRAGQQQQSRSDELLDGTSLKKEGSGPVATHKALRGCLSKGSSQHERRGQAPRDAKSGNGLLLLTRNQRGGGRATASGDAEQLEQSSLRASQRLQASSAITKQPVSFTKEPLGGSRQDANSASLSIMCERCGKCRCESCREPPPLPSRWLCDNACLCSAETVLDYASCLCCVKGLFYHCADGGLGPGPGSDNLDESSELAGNCADEPCSCAGPRSAARWSCLGALALFLPCLLCYWPLRGCVALCEACYAKHATQGCRCDPRSLRPLQINARHLSSSLAPAPISTVMSAADTARDPEKRLLEPSLPDL
uniref:Protein sprouty n=1 Tax=Trichogramma kaykai TaxID=54128 RepID=A0ABD2WS56_9HYME